MTHSSNINKNTGASTNFKSSESPSHEAVPHKPLVAVFRLIGFFLIISSYLVWGSLIYVFTKNPEARRRKLIANGSRYCRWIIKNFNVQVVCKNPIPANESSLLVGNHIGFIDILCLQALQPAVFITSTEMRNAPGLGQICEVGGCTYVNRKSRMGIRDELKDLINTLKSGFRVVLYAESVASNGEQVLPFKKTLMTAAAEAQVPIRPFVFNFLKINGEPVQFKHRDYVCWYGDQTFGPAIWRSLQLDSVICEIEFLPLVYPKVEDDRTVLAQKIHQMVSEKYVPFVPPA